MRKRIAIDINEVLRDFLRQFANMYKKVVDPSFSMEYNDMDDFNLINILPFLDENGNIDTYLSINSNMRTVLLKYMAEQKQWIRCYRLISTYGHRIQ